MKKKKIFIYIHQCILKGGVEKVFFNLLNNIPQEQYDITVLSHIAYLSSDIHSGLYPPHVRRRWLYYDEFSPKGPKRFLQRLHNFLMPRLYPLFLRLQRFDTAIAAQEGMYATFVAEKVRAKQKLVWIHNDIARCHWTQNLFPSIDAERNCYLRFDRVVCVSEAVKHSMNAVFGKMDNLCVCYNPIDTNEIEQKRNAFSVDRESAPLFVAVGRLVEQKGFDRMLRVCDKLNRDGLDYRLWIIGDGEDREALEKQRSEYNLQNVQFLGPKNNVFPYMQAADWLLCASRHEGFNLVLYEAGWCGTPSITTDNAGTKEFLGESEYGIVTENDETALYHAMRRVLTDPALLPHYQSAVKQRKSFIDLNTRIKEICNLL